ncbi:adenylyl-sulfate reductase subunit alpha [Anaerostipes sp. MSJ-23]|uniref:adenylyl-sulfate reductase subunit alpha n=1 Tax=Anaerostipes sp. MSJ-23 TaxID=2841520 RepID=UPI001C10482B|nr:adenylyl-sulfate reductase subunit alpha [Anaerostipes sp. MSJ-23]MBU5460514.1 adenylyl-sulfate reductase subunit alpha [Anaerostipes sp. MSJ-23]
MKISNQKIIHTDVLIIGGGTAGCYAALTIREHSKASIVIAEKANIKRSGCLAAGVNAINAYIVKGRKPQDYVDYARKDADEIVRGDLLLTMSEKLNEVTRKMEQLGLVILKDENGEYVARGNRNIKINGENIKPILADAVRKLDDVTVLNHLNITDYIVENNQILGAFGFSIEDGTAYEIRAKKVLCSTGGAAGLYKPNNPGFSRHKMWYPPFNTGAGYAMGINAGAEMTTFEMRFIALRCKDTIAPTGTIAQGVGAKQINSKGEVYEDKYGITTSQRVYGTTEENLEGRGPCYLRTEGIGKDKDNDLKKAYLNMAPSQTLKWIEQGKNPSEQNVEIEGTEPYIVGGHTASGYWVDTNRQTTIKGLYAAGDVAGGAPQKYVTGALVEGEIAALDIVKTLKEDNDKEYTEKEELFAEKIKEYNHILEQKDGLFTIEQMEEAMQKVMDAYAGGISSHYQFNENSLKLAKEKIEKLIVLCDQLSAQDYHELMFYYELRERLTVCLTLIEHLNARKETRWHSFAENLDHPKKSDDWKKYVNTKKVDGKIKVIYRELVKEDQFYEHHDQ